MTNLKLEKAKYILIISMIILRFYYFSEADELNGNVIEDIKVQYMCGCKLYCVFSKKSKCYLCLMLLM